jgi:membrane fusion protein, multidrug efflux system
MAVKENTIPRAYPEAREPASSANQKGDTKQKGKTRNGPPRRFLVIGAVIAVLGIFFGIRYWMYASTPEDTDDAYVTGNTHQISSRITGTVEQVLVDDNWHVTAGQPILKLDPRDYEVALTQARANYLQAKAQLVQASAQIPLVEAQLAQA